MENKTDGADGKTQNTLTDLHPEILELLNLWNGIVPLDKFSEPDDEQKSAVESLKTFLTNGINAELNHIFNRNGEDPTHVYYESLITSVRHGKYIARHVFGANTWHPLDGLSFLYRLSEFLACRDFIKKLNQEAYKKMVSDGPKQGTYQILGFHGSSAAVTAEIFCDGIQTEILNAVRSILREHDEQNPSSPGSSVISQFRHKVVKNIADMEQFYDRTPRELVDDVAAVTAAMENEFNEAIKTLAQGRTPVVEEVDAEIYRANIEDGTRHAVDYSTAGAAVQVEPSNNDPLKNDPMGKAMLLIKNQQGLSNSEVAKIVGVHPKTLNKPKWKPYRILRDSMRQGGSPPDGSKTKDGDIEAWEHDRGEK